MHRHSRRGFLARTLGAAWTGASLLERAAFVAAQARAQSRAPLPTLFDIEKLADGVYAAIARGRAIINSNAVIFENATDLLIVDAHAAPSAVYSLVAQIRREITEKPVRYVVASHMHGDHTQGLPAYRALAPKADIVACDRTRELMTQLGASRLKSAVDAVPRSIDNFQQRLSAAKSAEEKAYYQEMIAQSRAFLEEMRTVQVEMPNVTFTDHMAIHDRAHELHLYFRGRGHTAGDIVVLCPQKKVLASGDLAHSFFPTIGDGYPRDWPGTLRSIGELEFGIVAGGHGAAQRTHDRIGQLRSYFDEMIEIAGNAKRDGVPLERLLESVTPASLRSLGNGYGDFLASEVKRLDFRVHLSTQAEVLARGVRDNLSAVYRNFDRA